MDLVIGLVRAHPFWTLLIAFVALSVLSFVLFGGIGGSGSGGMDLGPIQQSK